MIKKNDSNKFIKNDKKKHSNKFIKNDKKKMIQINSLKMIKKNAFK